MFILNAYNEMQELPWYVVAITFLVPVLAGGIWYAFKTRHARSWRNGILPASLKFNQDNLLEAYLALGARLILLDYKSSKGKTQFINQYFNRYFRSQNYDFGDSLIFSMRYPIKIETVSSWLNEHLIKEGERAQVIYFLTGLALINGKLSQRELAFLQEMNAQLGLKIENLRRIIAIYRSYYEAKEKSEKETRQKRPSADLKKQYREILGVTTNATPEELKKTYRKLVKQHHPDVFANASDAQKRMAESKFIKIQEAYEALS